MKKKELEILYNLIDKYCNVLVNEKRYETLELFLKIKEIISYELFNL